MPDRSRKPDRDVQRGTAIALQRAFSAPDSHVGAAAAEADFAQLLAQLNDPPPQFQTGA